MTRPDPSSSFLVEAKPAPLLSITDLSVSFDMGSGPRVEAVNGLDLSIHPQQTLAVVGESGCGKSVTALNFLDD